MIPVDLATTPKLSRIKRRYHVQEALFWRESGDKSKKNFCLYMAKQERMNKCEFLANPSELPF